MKNLEGNYALPANKRVDFPLVVINSSFKDNGVWQHCSQWWKSGNRSHSHGSVAVSTVLVLFLHLKRNSEETLNFSISIRVSKTMETFELGLNVFLHYGMAI